MHTADLRKYIETEEKLSHTEKVPDLSHFAILVMPPTILTECDSPFIRRLSHRSLRLNGGYGSTPSTAVLLLGCVTSFVPKCSCKSHMPPLKTIIEVFHPSCTAPLPSAHQPRPNTVYPPTKRVSINAPLNGYKKYFTLRVGGVDAGILEGLWVGFDDHRQSARDTRW